MLCRTARKSILDIRIPISSSTIPPTFLLPNRARYFNTTAQHVDQHVEDIASEATGNFEAFLSMPKTHKTPRPKVPAPPSLPATPVAISENIKELLPLLRAQPSHYISAHIHGKPYLVTVGDAVRLPFHMPGVVPGDILRLNRATSLGSRDYTLKGAPYVDERLFECRAVVMGAEAEPLRTKTKTKRRNRKIKTVKSKHKFTLLKISELRVKSVEMVEEGAEGNLV